MAISFKAKVVKVGHSSMITIPKVICDNLNIEKGQVLRVKAGNKRIIYEI